MNKRKREERESDSEEDCIFLRRSVRNKKSLVGYNTENFQIRAIKKIMYKSSFLNVKISLFLDCYFNLKRGKCDVL